MNTASMIQQKPAVFLDRDGVLNKEKSYLCEWEDFEWLEGVKEGLVRLKNAGFYLVVVTNQSGIARGFYNRASAVCDADLGIMITASHNPVNENGFKIVRRGALPVSLNTGLADLKSQILDRPVQYSG